MTWTPIKRTTDLPNSGAKLWQCWSGYATCAERRAHAWDQFVMKYGRQPRRGWFIKDDPDKRYWMAV